MLRIALDSNVLLSGLFFEGNEEELLVAGLTGRYRIVLSHEIMVEVSDVVERKFRGSDRAPRAEAFLEDLKLAAKPHRRPYPKHTMRKAKALMRDADDVIHAVSCSQPSQTYLSQGTRIFSP